MIVPAGLGPRAYVEAMQSDLATTPSLEKLFYPNLPVEERAAVPELLES